MQYVIEAMIDYKQLISQRRIALTNIVVQSHLEERASIKK